MNIGTIGSGEMGVCLATKLTEFGHRVSITNSRGPASLKILTEDIGAKAVTLEEVVNNNQVVIVAIPTKNVPNIKHLFENIPKDIVVIDTMNYYPNLRDGFIPELDKTGIDSLWVQDQLGCSLVKAFNAILATSLKTLGRPNGDNNRIAIPVSGDNAQSKKVALNLINDIGYDSIDIGTIAQSWKQQPGSTIYCRDINLSVLKQRIDTLGANWFDIKEQATARRRDDEALMKKDYQAYLKTLKS